MKLTPLLLGVLLYTLGIGVSEPAYAGHYKLVQCWDQDGRGGDQKLCQAYQKNFEPRNDTEPMACERHYDPAIKGFVEPKWEKLDFNKYYGLYEKANVYGIEQQGRSPTKEDLDGFKGLAKWSHAELYIAHLDFDGDGKLANVLAIRSFTCGHRPKPDLISTDLFLLNDALTGIDSARQKNWDGWWANSTIELFDGKPYIEHYESDDIGGRNIFTWRGTFTVLKEISPEQVEKEHEEFEQKPHADEEWNGTRLRKMVTIQFIPSMDKSKNQE